MQLAEALVKPNESRTNSNNPVRHDERGTFPGIFVHRDLPVSGFDGKKTQKFRVTKLSLRCSTP